MRIFEMIREKDETGISGVGKVLEGVVFSDGVCVVRWVVANTENNTAVWPSFEAFKKIHIDAHPQNNTQITWLYEDTRN
jgi:hypothetical protein